jgi:TrmH family RNA methyltransferase
MGVRGKMIISSRQNSKVKEWRSLKRPEEARRSGKVLFEGAHPVLQALDHHGAVETVIVCPELAKPETALLVKKRVSAGGGHGDRRDGGSDVGGYGDGGFENPELLEVSQEVFDSITDRDGPSGIAAVARLKVENLNNVNPLCHKAPESGRELYIALWQIESPGNLGTIIRTANAFAAKGIILTGNCVNPYNSKTVKASMGAIFHTPLMHAQKLGTLVNWGRKFRYHLIGTSAKGRQIVPNTWEPKLPLVLLFGSEGSGLPAEAAGLLDSMVRIPMYGVNTSLNLSSAVAILAFLAGSAAHDDAL